MREESKIIEEYLRRYPQMCLPVKEGMSKSEGYKDYVLRGKQPEEYRITSPEVKRTASIGSPRRPGRRKFYTWLCAGTLREPYAVSRINARRERSRRPWAR